MNHQTFLVALLKDVDLYVTVTWLFIRQSTARCPSQIAIPTPWTVELAVTIVGRFFAYVTLCACQQGFLEGPSNIDVLTGIHDSDLDSDFARRENHALYRLAHGHTVVVAGIIQKSPIQHYSLQL